MKRRQKGGTPLRSRANPRKHLFENLDQLLGRVFIELNNLLRRLGTVFVLFLVRF